MGQAGVVIPAWGGGHALSWGRIFANKEGKRRRGGARGPRTRSREEEGACLLGFGKGGVLGRQASAGKMTSPLCTFSLPACVHVYACVCDPQAVTVPWQPLMSSQAAPCWQPVLRAQLCHYSRVICVVKYLSQKTAVSKERMCIKHAAHSMTHIRHTIHGSFAKLH